MEIASAKNIEQVKVEIPMIVDTPVQVHINSEDLPESNSVNEVVPEVEISSLQNNVSEVIPSVIPQLISEDKSEPIPVVIQEVKPETLPELIEEIEPEVIIKPLIISRETEEIIFYIFNVIAANFNQIVFGEESDEEEEEESEEESDSEEINIKVNTVTKVHAPKKSHQNLFIQLRKEMIDPISMMRNFEKTDDDNVRALKLDILVQSENLLSKLAERRQK